MNNQLYILLCLNLFFCIACATPAVDDKLAENGSTQPAPVETSPAIEFLVEPPADGLADSISIQRIENCGIETPTLENSLTLFDDRVNRLGGWSHIKSTSGEFAGVNLARTDYLINKENTVVDTTCSGLQTFPAVLVKKYGDWDRQHANGIETKFLEEGLLFSEVESIVIELKLDSLKTSILEPDRLQSLYSEYLTADELGEWDAGHVNLGITLFETGFNNQSTPSFTASVIIEIDQDQHADKWIQVTIPAGELDYFTEQNYDPTPADLADYSDNLILGFRLNPETSNGRTLRSYVPNSFPNDAAEQFKEMSIVIKRISVKLR